MPELCRFFGIIIRMYFNDHDPPHFHAVYGEDEVLIEIDTLVVVRGELPRRALALVVEWADVASGRTAAGLGVGTQWPPARTHRPA
jgi:Domain of unknown function (DUF4160)